MGSGEWAVQKGRCCGTPQMLFTAAGVVCSCCCRLLLVSRTPAKSAAVVYCTGCRIIYVALFQTSIQFMYCTSLYVLRAFGLFSFMAKSEVLALVFIACLKGVLQQERQLFVYYLLLNVLEEILEGGLGSHKLRPLVCCHLAPQRLDLAYHVDDVCYLRLTGCERLMGF